MAARRLLILLLVLLGISTLAAALAPVKSNRDKAATDTTRTATTETSPAVTAPTTSVAEPAAKSAAGLFKYTIDAGAKPVTVQLYVGEELRLTVESKLFDQISIPELGQVKAVSPNAAAEFDLLLDEAGDYAVKLVDENRVVGRLEVSPGARPEKDRKKASAHPAQQ